MLGLPAMRAMSFWGNVCKHKMLLYVFRLIASILIALIAVDDYVLPVLAHDMSFSTLSKSNIFSEPVSLESPVQLRFVSIFEAVGFLRNLRQGQPWWAAVEQDLWPEGLWEDLEPLWVAPHGDRAQEIVPRSLEFGFKLVWRYVEPMCCFDFFGGLRFGCRVHVTVSSYRFFFSLQLGDDRKWLEKFGGMNFRPKRWESNPKNRRHFQSLKPPGVYWQI